MVSNLYGVVLIINPLMPTVAMWVQL